MSHRYRIGQIVELRTAPRHSNRPAGPCEIIACLPHEKGPVLYRVKSRGETNERVVEEIDLSPSTAVKSAMMVEDDVFSIAVAKR